MARVISFTPEGRTRSAQAVIADSMSDLANWQATTRQISSGWGYSSSAKQHLLTGDASLVARADKLMDAIEAASPMDDSKRELVRTVAGGLADVPAYLSGSPVAMRRRQRRETQAPLKIVVDVTSSASVNDTTLARRGVAALALLRKLEAAGHAVEIWAVEAVGSGRTTGFCFVRLESQPLDLSRACWALASAEFSRECAFTACNTVQGDDVGGWPWNNAKWNGHPEAQRIAYAQALGCEAATLLILPPLYNDTEAQPFKSDAAAVQWANAMYAQAVDMAGLLQ